VKSEVVSPVFCPFPVSPDFDTSKNKTYFWFSLHLSAKIMFLAHTARDAALEVRRGRSLHFTLTLQCLSFRFLDTEDCRPLKIGAISSCCTSAAASGRNLSSLGVLRIAVSPRKMLSAILRTCLH
jgi:hypothetical protein